ncbi:hypothetical protein GBA52_019404, partial [Prunus armeniaca]
MSLGVLAEILDPKEVIQEAYSPKHLTQRKNNQFMDRFFEITGFMKLRCTQCLQLGSMGFIQSKRL